MELIEAISLQNYSRRGLSFRKKRRLKPSTELWLVSSSELFLAIKLVVITIKSIPEKIDGSETQKLQNLLKLMKLKYCNSAFL